MSSFPATVANVMKDNTMQSLPIGNQKPLCPVVEQFPRCECGSSTVYGEDTPFHATYCPRYVQPPKKVDSY